MRDCTHCKVCPHSCWDRKHRRAPSDRGASRYSSLCHRESIISCFCCWVDATSELRLRTRDSSGSRRSRGCWDTPPLHSPLCRNCSTQSEEEKQAGCSFWTGRSRCRLRARVCVCVAKSNVLRVCDQCDQCYLCVDLFVFQNTDIYPLIDHSFGESLWSPWRRDAVTCV